MADDTREKLSILLPHLIAHNNEHAADLDKWAEKAGAAGETRAAEALRDAAEAARKANRYIEKALERTGSGSEKPESDRKHHHHHGESQGHRGDHREEHGHHHHDHTHSSQP